MVIGDIMLDHYLNCAVERISPEAPVPVAKVQGESFILGGAANVANNLASLGARVELVGRIGKDSQGKIIKSLLKGKKIGSKGVFKSQIPTIEKTRIICGNHQLVRVDREIIRESESVSGKKAINYILSEISFFDAIIFSDYAKGFISESFAARIIKKAREKKVKVISDPTPYTFFKFKDSFLIKPNKKAAEIIAGEKFTKDYSNLRKIGKLLQRKAKSDILITLGKDGAAICEGGKFIKIDASDGREVYDVSGAGDTFIAALTLCLASGLSLQDSAIAGNICSGIVVNKLGTAICSKEEFLNALQSDKIF
jgi:D-beta-D-heptose 7-phosphate kinase/D-beta-D-heptose 1-phosphate adenosyltransferase